MFSHPLVQYISTGNIPLCSVEIALPESFYPLYIWITALQAVYSHGVLPSESG